MKPLSWRTVTDGVRPAFNLACSEREPVFVPYSIYSDDRGWSIMNQLNGVMTSDGQINYSVMYPGVIKAWHRHQLQTDFWMCLNGQLKVGVFREDGTCWLGFIGEMKPGLVVIPPPLWHGAATVGDRQCGLLYYVTQAYNHKNPDEERMPYDQVKDFPWTVRQG